MSVRNTIAFLLFTVFISCSEEQEVKQPSLKEIQEALLEANIKATEMESQQIEAYIKQKELSVIATGTGLRYSIYHKGDQIIKGELGKRAVINYQVTLLNGDTCYSTGGKPEELLVGEDYAESGLHEAIQLMYQGDKAIVIIPSHLAHGLAGDLKKIPIRSTIVYDIELVQVK
ncbi:MAG: FKBP-type peptidyl-prolyl cis-trans isomerase [Vicingus serpentipes]|nr:FKBP-type peptidyl-prolyl cis-trans isomerase [Vicingus serpentipes]